MIILLVPQWSLFATHKTETATPLGPHTGPAMLAFTLMMCALSLRTWRRNGVACDELLFLPGTAHGQNHGIEGPLVESPPKEPLPPPVPPGNRSSTPKKKKRKLKAKQSPKTPQLQPQQQQQQKQKPLSSRSLDSMEIEMAELGKVGSSGGGIGTKEGDVAAGGGTNGSSSSHSSMRHRGSNASLELEVELEESFSEDNQDMTALLPKSTSSNSREGLLSKSSSDHRLHSSDSFSGDCQDGVGANNNDTNNTHANNDYDDSNNDLPDDSEALLGAAHNAVHRFGENHPRIVRIGSFFFFRSSTSTTQNESYAPSGPSVFGAGLDLSMPILFNFHLFIEAYNHLEESGEATAKILPIIFLSVLLVRTMVPPGRRGRFWSTMHFTFTAPMHRLRFRDGFVGDVLTSLVRPGQDIFFALSYYCTVIYGTVTGEYGLTRSSTLLEESRLLHNVVLPTCAILPLWWKYLQTLRQAYDNNSRWPYQGNSLKYLLSTLVVIYGMTHPEDRRSPWWVLAFCVTLAYQVWWDVVMDWELFEIQRGGQLVDAEQDSWCSRISSFRPSSHVLLRLQMYVVQPVLDLYQRLRAQTPSWRQIQIRQKRLYKTEAFYWKIFAFNLCMRFTWMLCFIPAYHFSDAGEKKVLTSSSDTNNYLGVLLPVAEILRRCFWGFLFLEKETIKMMESDVMYSPVEAFDEGDEDGDQDNEEGEGDDDSKANVRSTFRTQLLPTWLGTQQQVAHDAATVNVKHRDLVLRRLFVAEIFGWAAAFVILGCWAAR
jgi:hypothetical protein